MYSLERIGDELRDDPAAGAGEPVDQSVRHVLKRERGSESLDVAELAARIEMRSSVCPHFYCFMFRSRK